jgi:hypothetical protein
LLFCARPCINGISRLSFDPDEYQAGIAAKVRARRATDPRLASEFKRRVLLHEDQRFFSRLLTELHSAEAAVPEEEP